MCEKSKNLNLKRSTTFKRSQIGATIQTRQEIQCLPDAFMLFFYRLGFIWGIPGPITILDQMGPVLTNKHLSA